MLVLAASLSLTLTSCGSDDDEPNIPPQPTQPTTSDISSSGTVGLSTYVWVTSKMGFICYDARNVTAINGGMLHSYGIVNNLNDITTVPSSGWDNQAPLFDGGGYTLSYVEGGVSKYVRFMLTTNKDATGKVVGINYAYQFFTPVNL